MRVTWCGDVVGKALMMHGGRRARVEYVRDYLVTFEWRVAELVILRGFVEKAGTCAAPEFVQ